MASQGNDCYFYYYSECAKGHACPFRHCAEALGNEEVCSLWREGRCFRGVCSYRHMEMEKKRSAIPCYWESQPSGCLKQHCPFLHSNQSGGAVGNAIADVKAAVPLQASIPVKRLIPSPMVEPIVVNPQDDVDDTSSVEISPVKTIPFSSKTIRLGTKEEKPVGGGSVSGIKTLSQLRNTKDVTGPSASQAAVGDPILKAVAHRKIISFRNVYEAPIRIENQIKIGEEEQMTVLTTRSTAKRKLHVANDEVIKSGRSLMSSQERRLPTRIFVKSGGDSSDTSKATPVLSQRIRRPSGEKPKSSPEVANEVSEKGDAGIKSLEQIRRERRAKVRPALSSEHEMGVKSLEQIRRKRRVIKMETDVSHDDDVALVKSLDEIRKERTRKRRIGGPNTEGDIGVKTLEQIRQEKEGVISTLVSSDLGDAGVESSEQVRRERIARRLGLLAGEKKENQEHERASGDSIVGREQKEDEISDGVGNNLGKAGSILRRLGPAVTPEEGEKDGRNIAVRDGDSETAGEEIATDRFTVSRNNPEVSSSDLNSTVVKPKRRRVTILNATIDKQPTGTADVENGVKSRLGRMEKTDRAKEGSDGDGEVEMGNGVKARLGTRERRGGSDGERNQGDGESVVDKDEESLEKKKPQKKITIKRNESRMKNPVRRRADRQIYQPPRAKFEGRSSRTEGQSESQEAEEEIESKEKIDHDSEEAKIQSNNSLRTKRPRITFQADGIGSFSSDTARTNAVGPTDLKAEPKTAVKHPEGKTTVSLTTGLVKLNPLGEESSKPSTGKRRKGVGLRERLLQQSQKFAIGVVTAVEEDQNNGDQNSREKSLPEISESKVTDPSSHSGQSDQKDGTTFERLTTVKTKRPKSEEIYEQSVVSSSIFRSETPAEKVTISSVLQDDVDHLQEVKGEQLYIEKPSSTSATTAGVVLSSTSVVDTTPDSTNPPIPSIAVSPLAVSFVPDQLEREKEDNVDEKIGVGGIVRTASRKMSLTDDEFAGLLDDVGDGDDDFNDEEDDDALLEELEDLINN